MPLYQVISGLGGSKELVEVGAGGGGETWGVHVNALPTDPSALIADLPVGAFVTDNEGGGADLEPRVVALEEDMTAITQTVTDGDTSKTTVAAHQDANGIYGVATDTKYGHVRLLSDPSVETMPAGATFSASAIKELMSGRGTIQWPGGSAPSIGTLVSDSQFLITSSGEFELPAGKYAVELVGGGARGGNASGNAAGCGGAGGNSAIPIVGYINTNTAVAVQVTIGASGGTTSLTCSVSSLQAAGATGTARAGSCLSSYGQAKGADGNSYTMPGGKGSWQSAGGSYMYYVGGSGGDGSRFSYTGPLAQAVQASSGGTAEAVANCPNVPGGQGGYGFGAGGGGGGHHNCTNSGRNGSGGAGAPGAILITVLF